MEENFTERNSFAILFYIRNDKINKNGEVPVYLRITIDKAKAEYSTGERIAPNIWNEGRVKGNSGSAKRVKETMDVLRGRVMELRRNYDATNEPLTARYIVDLLNGKTTTKTKSKSVIEVFKLHNGMVYNLVGIDYALATYTRYETTLKHSHNTTMKYIKMFKVITNYAVKNDWLDKDPFKLFECKIEKIERDHLTEDEIQRIRALENGITPQTVMKITGHTDYKSMQPYIDVTDKAKVKAVNIFD